MMKIRDDFRVFESILSTFFTFFFSLSRRRVGMSWRAHAKKKGGEKGNSLLCREFTISLLTDFHNYEIFARTVDICVYSRFSSPFFSSTLKELSINLHK